MRVVLVSKQKQDTFIIGCIFMLVHLMANLGMTKPLSPVFEVFRDMLFPVDSKNK